MLIELKRRKNRPQRENYGRGADICQNQGKEKGL